MTNEQLVKLGNAFAEGLYEGLVNNSTEVNRENDDLIRRQDVLALAKDITLQNGCKHRCIDATMIHELPSAQKTGKWIDDNGNRTQQYRNNFKCSECGHYQHTPVAKRVDEFEQENKFCHWCGSLMRGDTNG